jgi:hypothetical protein
MNRALPLLTDDEVIALAVAREMVWPGGTPTVDTESRAQLIGAAFRGDRSLLARGLLHGDDGGSPAESIGDWVNDAPGRIVVYIGDDRLARSSWGIASAHYPSAEGWLLETVSAVGLHRFSVEALSDHRTYLDALLKGAEQAGPEGVDDGQRLCLLATTPRGVLLATGRRGEVAVATRPPVSSDVSESFETVSPSDAIDRLIAAMTARLVG